MPSWSEIVRREVRRLQQQQELSEAELSRRAGIPQTTINRFLNGTTRTVQIDTIGAVARGLGVHPSSLLGGIEAGLEDEERELLNDYRKLRPEAQAHLRALIKSMGRG